MTEIGVIAAAMGFGHATGFLSLWLRLRSREVEDESHRRLLVAILRDLPPGAELRDQRPDGACLTLTVPPEDPGLRGVTMGADGCSR